VDPNEQFVLNLTTLAAIGGIMGVLTGAISFLTKALISSKDEQIAHIKEQQERNEKRMAREVEYWRSFSVHLLEPAEQARLEKMFADRKKADEEEDY
jgi:NAD kinase